MHVIFYLMDGFGFFSDWYEKYVCVCVRCSLYFIIIYIEMAKH